MFNLESAINLRFSNKVQRFTASSHRSSKMKHQNYSDTEFNDFTELAMQDLEDESDRIFEGFS